MDPYKPQHQKKKRVPINQDTATVQSVSLPSGCKMIDFRKSVSVKDSLLISNFQKYPAEAKTQFHINPGVSRHQMKKYKGESRIR